jgi:hypothetical protein
MTSILNQYSHLYDYSLEATAQAVAGVQLQIRKLPKLP